jgi:uncharacterized protein (TIGR03437 family)
VTISGTALSSAFPGISATASSGAFAYVTSLFINATVMSAANYMAGVVAPGEIVAIRGYGFNQDVGETTSALSSGLLPRQYLGITIMFDEFPALLIYLQSQQINVQVPWEIAGRNSVKMAVQIGSQVLGPYVVAAAPSVPGIFYINNSDGTRTRQPIRRLAAISSRFMEQGLDSRTLREQRPGFGRRRRSPR